MEENYVTDNSAEETEYSTANAGYAEPAPEEAQPVQSATAKTEKSGTKSKKPVIAATYAFALLFMLMGLFLPLYNGFGLTKEHCLFWHVVGAGKEFIQVFRGGAFNCQAFLILLYTLLCVVGGIMLIPVLAGKKDKRTSEICAFVPEVIVLLFTAFYIFFQAIYNLYIIDSATIWVNYRYIDYNMLVALFGVFAMACVQSIATKKSIGIFKTVTGVLSILCALCILSVPFFIPVLAKPLANFSDILKSGMMPNMIVSKPGEAGALTALTTGLGIDGIGLFLDKASRDILFATKEVMPLVIYSLFISVSLLVLINLALDFIGLTTGRWEKDGDYCANVGLNAFDLVRYALTFLATLALIILNIMYQPVTNGIYIYFLIFFLAIMLILCIVRTVTAILRCKKQKEERAQQKLAEEEAARNAEETEQVAETEPDAAAEPVAEVEAAAEPVAETAYEPYATEETYEQQPEEQETAEPFVAEETPAETTGAEPEIQPFEAFAAPAAEFTPTNEVEEQLTFPMDSAPYSYSMEPQPQPQPQPQPTYYVYSGVTDPFMDTLTDNEKVEFVEAFLKKSRGTVNGIPDYEVNGNNDDFFTSVFVHINRVRAICSDALLAKIYKQLGNM